MALGTDPAAEAGSGALAEPTEPPPTRWLVSFCLATLGTFVGWYGPLQILLAKQADLLSPATKESVLAWVAGVGAAASLVANPLWGAASDRTTSRWGRRVPYVLAGGLAGAAGLVVLSRAGSVGGLIVGWCLVQVALNAPFAALCAAIPDQVPLARRGTVGGWFGVAQTVGIIAGTGLAAAGGSVTGGYAACAVFVVLAVLPFVLLRRDPVVPRSAVPSWDLGELARSFWVSPREHPDFAWAWVTRFLINLGNAIALLYLWYYLKDEVGADDPDGAVFLLTVVYALALLSTVVVSGTWSDRVGRRRVFVVAAGVVMAVAALVLAFVPTFGGAVVAAVVLGTGFGVYTSVDFALVTQVLPAAVSRGKDLGVINIANALPQVLAPVVAAPLVAHLGGYPVLYTVSAAVGLVGAALVLRIRSVR